MGRGRAIRGARAGLAALTLLLTAAGAARADFDSGHYSHSGSGCSSGVDPITLVFYGASADQSHARSVLQERMGWSGDRRATQYATSHGECTRMDGESYSGCGICVRHHVRLNETQHQDAEGRSATVGTPHYDELAFCGVLPRHVASSFNYTRNLVAGRMSTWYGVSWQYWGNTQVMYQCDGRGVAADGTVAWVNLG